MSEGFLLRVRYSITGRLAWLSHLETIRSMERVVRRARLPYAITEGFNPHMKISFGPALPVGAGSNGEYFDVRLREYLEPEQALEQLRAAAAPNLMPEACAYVPVGSDAIDVAYPVSVWEVAVTGGEGISPEESSMQLQTAFEKLLEQGYITIEKKKGRRIVEKKVEFEGRLLEPPLVTFGQSGALVNFSTFQGPAGALRADKFVAEACKLAGEGFAWREITRLELKPASEKQ